MLKIFQEKFEHLNHQVNYFLLLQKLKNHLSHLKTYIEYLWCLGKYLHYLDESLDNVESNGTWLIDSLSYKLNKTIFEDFFWAKPDFDLLRWLE
jgi:uncharacterized protein YbcV (DUF1398 family)